MLVQDINIFRFTEAPSTNDLARERQYVHGDLLMADVQTEGRGQRGNTWMSAPGENLTFSLVVEPGFLPARNQFLLSECAALATVDALALLGVDAQVKWPNDIYVDGKKIAGILIENDILGDNLCRSVIGVGLNVNQTAFPDHLPNATSIALAEGQTDLGKALGAWCDAFIRRYSMLEAIEWPRIESDYHQRLYLKDTLARFEDSRGAVFEARIRRVASSGELHMELPGGATRRFLFNEVQFLT